MCMDRESLEYRLQVKNDKVSRFFLAQEMSVSNFPCCPEVCDMAFLLALVDE
jgi:hypothetical protein